MSPAPPVPKVARRRPIGKVLSSIQDLETKDIPKPAPPSQVPIFGKTLNCCSSDMTISHVRNEHFNDNLPVSKDLFVFGRQDKVFKFGKFLGGVGSTVKRLFGFRSWILILNQFDIKKMLTPYEPRFLRFPLTLLPTLILPPCRLFARSLLSLPPLSLAHALI